MPEEGAVFLTKEGLKKLKEEYLKLQKERERRIKMGVPPALQSEEMNSDYILFKEEMDSIDKKIFRLKNILENAKLIKKPPKGKQNIVSLGARVWVEYKGELHQFRIVDSLEANPSLGKISIHSSVGNFLLGRKVGDVVLVSTKPRRVYKIKKIWYGDD